MTRDEKIDLGLDYYKKNKNELVSLYKEIYGETICLKCKKGTIEYAYAKIVSERDKPICNYKMRRGCVINTYMTEIEGIPKGHYTCHNMTNEIAEILIKHGYGKFFI